MKYMSFASFILFSLLACQPVNHKDKNIREDNKLDQLSWILGKWRMETPEGIVNEEWQKPSDTQWQGISYMVTAGGDTPFKEKIRLTYSNDTLYYKPTVNSQNEGKEISFTEKNLSDSLIVFENLRHDFPQRIIYKRTSDTSILATIEGNQNGQMRREEFAYYKRK